MTDYTLCRPDREDIPELKKLWSDIFQDSRECIDGFFRRYFSTALAAVVKCHGKVVSMAYIVHQGKYFYSENAKSCAMIYAVATANEYRRRGFGAMATDYARRIALESGFELVSLVPANSSLFSFYEKLGFKTAFYIDEVNLYSADSPLQGVKLISAGAQQYLNVRQSLLKGENYVSMDLKALEYQKFLCGMSHGDMCLIELAGRIIGCVCWEMEEKRANVKEYICPLPPEKTLGSINAREYKVWTCGRSKPFAMVYGDIGDIDDGYYGFAFG